MNGPFHRGELQAQRLAGVVGAGGGIRNFMPDQHREFFAMLPFVLAASADPDGAPRAHVLHGAPGFVASPDPHTLTIASGMALDPGAPLGLLGLDFGTRRRNRANGVVRSSGAGALVLEVRESFGNCPKHITLRDVVAAPHAPGARSEGPGLGDAGRALIERADTFFIATSGLAAGGQAGLDISHRGGPAGFAAIDGDTLVVPDYAGNRYFNTLGNVLLDARAALLFIDFASGDVLELQGSIQIDWEAHSWRFACARHTLTRVALPLRWQDR